MGLDVCFINPLLVLQGFSWDRHAPAWLLEPGWSPALPGGTLAQDLRNGHLVLSSITPLARGCWGGAKNGNVLPNPPPNPPGGSTSFKSLMLTLSPLLLLSAGKIVR